MNKIKILFAGLITILTLTGTAIAPDSDKLGDCYGWCYEIAKPCYGRDDCNAKSNGCYDWCDAHSSSDGPLISCN